MDGAFLFTILIGSVIFGFVGLAIADHKGASGAAGFWLGFFLWPIGLVIAALLGPSGNTVAATPSSPKRLRPAEANLDSANYKAWLIDEYGIEKNDVMDSFICDDRAFHTVEAALEHAHSLETDRRAEEAEQAEAEQQKLEEDVKAKRKRVLLYSAAGIVAIIAWFFFDQWMIS